jgi:hypothetical protein
MNANSFYGFICPRGCESFEVQGSVGGGNMPTCSVCGSVMVPNLNSRGSTANAYCKKCKSISGLVTSDVCPECGGPFSAPPF